MRACRDELNACEGDRSPAGIWDRFACWAIVISAILFAGSVSADSALVGRPVEMVLADRFVYFAAFGVSGASLFLWRVLRRL